MIDLLTRRGKRPTDTGMVSIMVTMIMMLVISLIVLGFAQVSRREQNQSLDRQLSTQAYFAAETAVNDARTAIATLPAGAVIPEKTNCGTDSVFYNKTASMNIDPANNVSYTCLLVTSKLDNLTRHLTGGGASGNFPLEVDPAFKINKLHIKWSSDTLPTVDQTKVNTCNTNVPATGSMPPSGLWKCPYGIIRMDIVPTDANSLSRAAMAAEQKTMLFYPTKGGGSSVTYAGSDGKVVEMKCLPSATICEADITGFPATESTYAIRASALYADGTMEVTATDAANNTLELKNAQIQVDATGKAQNVLRRIQVRLPLSKAASSPDYALESASSICKKFDIGATSFTIPTFARPQDKKNPMCRPIVVHPPCSSPSDIVLVLDTSMSLRDNWGSSTIQAELTRVAKRFVNSTSVRPDYNHEAIVGFSMDVTYYLPFSSSPTQLTNFIGTMDQVYGTQYGPPLRKTLDIFTDGTADGRRPGVPKVLVFVSDGEDAGDKDADVAQAQILKDSGITIYTIGINTENIQMTTLKRMATTLDTFTDARNIQDLDDTMDEIAAGIRCD
jgi:hypothetical protein